MLGSSGSVPVTGVTHGGSSIVVNTPPGVTGLSSSTFATINKRMQSQGPSATASLVQVQTVSGKLCRPLVSIHSFRRLSSQFLRSEAFQ